MEGFFSVAVPLFLIIGLAVVIYKFLRLILKAQGEAWNKAAVALGLTYDPGNFIKRHRISGKLNGHTVTVWTYTTGDSDNSRKYTGYEVRHLPVGPPIVLIRQTSLSFLRAFVGKKDHKVGDPHFDKNVVVNTTDPEAVAEFLTHTRRSAVLMLFEHWGKAKITQDTVSVSTPRHEKSSDKIIATVNRLVDVAAIMQSPDKVETVLTHQNDGDLTVAVAELHTLNNANPNTFVQLLEIEALTADAQPEAAAAVLDLVSEKLPADPQVQDWSRVLKSPAEPRQINRPIAVSLDRQDVIEDVFASTRKRVEVERHFDAVYRGASVNWVGVVKATRSYRVDADFGIDSGTKVTIALGEALTSKYATAKIEAIVNFDADARIKRGDKVRFAGTMVKADRLMRKIYIDDATIRS